MASFSEALRVQRLDDHRYYHHCRINQSLHFLSAASFLCGYALLFVSPAKAALVGWLIAMTTRQAGHFFFEPKGYDEINQATHEHKERIKVGYNLRRKVALLTIWALSPLLLMVEPTLWGVFAADSAYTLLDRTALIWLWIGIGGVLFRTVHLFFIASVQTGLVWLTKILTDPFNDIRLYHRAPLFLLRGERFAPHHARS
jgi:hypothetical protein